MKNFLKVDGRKWRRWSQDGCGYNLDGACYDLSGFGTNACNVNKESIEKAFN